MLEKPREGDNEDLSNAQGPNKAMFASYETNLKECLIKGLLAHIQTLHGTDIGEAVLKLAGLDAGGQIFHDAQAEATIISAPFTPEEYFKAGTHFGLYTDARLINGRLSEVDLLAKLNPAEK